jgi:hypothetical protein
MYTAKERKRYNEDRDRACQRAGITKNQYNWLRRKGEELHNVYVDQCNGDIAESDYERLTDPIYESVNTYISKLGLSIYYQTDPRGATIYIDRQPIPENNYTQAICVY